MFDLYHLSVVQLKNILRDLRAEMQKREKTIDLYPPGVVPIRRYEDEGDYILSNLVLYPEEVRQVRSAEHSDLVADMRSPGAAGPDVIMLGEMEEDTKERDT